jgi:hypothetical protein
MEPTWTSGATRGRRLLRQPKFNREKACFIVRYNHVWSRVLKSSHAKIAPWI